jgi:hypothetical protein
MRDFHTTQNELAPGNQLMNVVANANMNHVRIVEITRATTKQFIAGPPGLLA